MDKKLRKKVRATKERALFLLGKLQASVETAHLVHEHQMKAANEIIHALQTQTALQGIYITILENEVKRLGGDPAKTGGKDESEPTSQTPGK
jgi:hypothetical protein